MYNGFDVILMAVNLILKIKNFIWIFGLLQFRKLHMLCATIKIILVNSIVFVILIEFLFDSLYIIHQIGFMLSISGP